jgi:hypothetical protein
LALLSNGNFDGFAHVDDRLTANKTFGTIHCNSTHGRFSQMLGDLKYQAEFMPFDLKGVQNVRQGAVELDIDDGSDNLGDLSGGGFAAGCASCLLGGLGKSTLLLGKNL